MLEQVCCLCTVSPSGQTVSTTECTYQKEDVPSFPVHLFFHNIQRVFKKHLVIPHLTNHYTTTGSTLCVAVSINLLKKFPYDHKLSHPMQDLHYYTALSS